MVFFTEKRQIQSAALRNGLGDEKNNEPQVESTWTMNR
jgi:hypothetical protein